MIKKQLSPESSDGGTGFANLSEDEVINIYFPEKGEEKKEKKEENLEEKQDDNKSPEIKDSAKETEIDKGDEKGEEPKKEDDEGNKLGEEEIGEDGFKNPGEKEEKGADSESSWVNVAKEIGIELKEDSFDAFKTAQKEFIENQIKEKEVALKQSKFEDEISSLPLKEQVVMRGVKQGLTLEQINKPYDDIKELKSMSDADLVAKDFELMGYPQDLIEHKITKLTEDGELEISAKEIRLILDKNLETLDQKNLDAIKEIEIANNKKTEQAQEKAVSNIKSTLDTIQTFMDAPLSKKNKEYVVKQLEQGKYHSILKEDPKVAAEFILFKEFGQQAITNLKSKSIEEGRDKKAAKLHVIPPVIKSSGSVAKKGEVVDPVGNWGAFDHLLPKG